MIILGVCQDPKNTSNIYILYRHSNSLIGNNSTYNGVTNSTYNNLYITYSNSGGNTTNSTNFNFNTEVRVVLESSGTTNSTSDGVNTVFSGYILAYNNFVYVIYTNTNGKLFLTRLKYTTSGLALDTNNTQNTFTVNNTTSITPTTGVTAGEGNNYGGHVLDYSLDDTGNLVLHILYHGCITGFTNNKVYYYLTVTNLISGSPIFSSIECVVPFIYQNNTDSTTRTIGYGDMVVDRINKKIYIVYSTHNYPVQSTGINIFKEHNRFIVYTNKNFTDNSTAWINNSEFDICSGTTSGFAQAIYRNPNSTTSECFSSCD